MGLTVEYEIEELKTNRFVARRRDDVIICVADTETDPFLYGRIPKAFTIGFYDGADYVDFWGPDCIAEFFEYLRRRREAGDKLCIYVHNGGKYDFYNSFMPYFDLGQKPLIIHGRLTQVWFGGVEFRDSYKIIPAPLRAYKKDEISYDKFEVDVRANFEAEIRHYQKQDCLYLYDLVREFEYMFGECISIGEAAIRVLNSTVGFARLSAGQDRLMRPWFMGGRTQCFESGVIKGDFKVVDVNSMYPDRMRNVRHPVGKETDVQTHIGPDTCFLKLKLRRNDGAFAQVTETGIDFTRTSGDFFCTIHEFEAAEDLGLIKVDKIITAVNVFQQATFEEFVDRFYTLRLQANANNDDLRKLIYKLLLNNAYGKFAQNPAEYCDYWLGDHHELPPEHEEIGFYNEANPDGWAQDSEYLTAHGGMWTWKKASANRWRGYRNVMTAASITGAARAKLMRGLAAVERPVYCDTDSIVCEGTGSLDLDDKSLGGWKLEATGSRFACAGKKLYALFSEDPQTKPGADLPPMVEGLYAVKMASKGAKLAAEEILRVARGGIVEDRNQVPNFKLDGTAQFITRKIKRTDERVKKFGKSASVISF